MKKSRSVIGAVSIALGGFLLFSCSQPAKASIQSFSARVEQVLQVEIPGSVVIDYGEADSEVRSTDFDIIVTTNNRTGYTLTGNGPTYLYNTSNSSQRLQIAENDTASMYSNRWWIKKNNGTYLYTSSTTLNYSKDPVVGDDNKFTFYSKVDTGVIAGTFSGNVSFFVTANSVPDTIAYIDYLQQINNNVVMSMKEGKYYELKDQRDDKKYWVVFDGTDIKMAQNLDYDIDSSVALTSSTSNVPSNIQLSNNTIVGGDLATSWVESDTAPQSYDNPVVYKVSDDEIYSSIEACVLDGHSEFECKRAHIGNSYNWSAAVAMNDTSAYTQDGENTSASQSICPSAWELPTRANESYATSNVPDDKSAALSVRCIGIKPIYTLTYRIDNHYQPYWQEVRQAGAWIKYAFETIDAEYVFDNVHELAGWSTYSNSRTPSYPTGSKYPMPGYTGTLYAVWRDKELTLDDITTMQEMTRAIIRNTPEGTSKMLTDTRDGKRYWVTKFGGEDGDIWMTQNLDYDIPAIGRQIRTTASTTVTPSDETTLIFPMQDSDVLYSYGTTTFTGANGYNFDGRDYYYIDGRTKTPMDNFTENDERWHYHVGNYYTITLAKLFYTYSTYFSSSSSSDNDNTNEYKYDDTYNTRISICPKGWGLPTNREFKRFGSYTGEKYNVYGGYLKDDAIITDEGTVSRYISNSAFYPSDSSSSRYNYRYVFDFGNSKRIASSFNFASAYDYVEKKWAFSVRCIARKDIDINNPTGSRLESR